MIVNDGGMREEDRQIVAMDAAGEIHILWIHKESLIEQTRFLHRLCAQQHKATAEIRDVHQLVVARAMHLVGLVVLLHPSFGQESSAKHIPRGWKEFAKVL